MRYFLANCASPWNTYWQQNGDHSLSGWQRQGMGSHSMEADQRQTHSAWAALRLQKPPWISKWTLLNQPICNGPQGEKSGWGKDPKQIGCTWLAARCYAISVQYSCQQNIKKLTWNVDYQAICWNLSAMCSPACNRSGVTTIEEVHIAFLRLWVWACP